MRSNGHSPSNGTWRTNPEVLEKVFSESVAFAVEQAIAEHHRAGNPVAIWRDGRIVMLYPDGSTIPVEEYDAAQAAAADR
jgi:hypothetical protein